MHEQTDVLFTNFTSSKMTLWEPLLKNSDGILIIFLFFRSSCRAFESGT